MVFLKVAVSKGPKGKWVSLTRSKFIRCKNHGRVTWRLPGKRWGWYLDELERAERILRNLERLEAYPQWDSIRFRVFTGEEAPMILEWSTEVNWESYSVPQTVALVAPMEFDDYDMERGVRFEPSLADAIKLEDAAEIIGLTNRFEPLLVWKPLPTRVG